MTDVERLKTIQRIKDRMISIYDEYRFNSKETDYQNFKKVQEMQELLNELVDDYVATFPSYVKVVATEDTIIEPGETVEIKTNITGSQNLTDLVFEGYIPTAGRLVLSSIHEENGIEIYAKNNVPRSVFENNTEGYHYCDPTTTRYFWAGVYQIQKGTTIGIAITKQNEKEDNQYNERFYECEFSSYDFMCLFCALSAAQRKYSFSRDNLIRFIEFCKANNQFTSLLDDIQLKRNGISSYSEELDEAIAKLKWGKVLYTVSPERDSSVSVFEDIPMSKLIEKRISYFDEMISFLYKYSDYELKNISNAQQQICSQETANSEKDSKTFIKEK